MCANEDACDSMFGECVLWIYLVRQPSGIWLLHVQHASINPGSRLWNVCAECVRVDVCVCVFVRLCVRWWWFAWFDVTWAAGPTHVSHVSPIRALVTSQQHTHSTYTPTYRHTHIIHRSTLCVHKTHIQYESTLMCTVSHVNNELFKIATGVFVSPRVSLIRLFFFLWLNFRLRVATKHQKHTYSITRENINLQTREISAFYLNWCRTQWNSRKLYALFMPNFSEMGEHLMLCPQANTHILHYLMAWW